MATITFTESTRYNHCLPGGRFDVERFKAGETHIMPDDMAGFFLVRGQAHIATPAEVKAYRAAYAAKRAA